MRSVDLLIEKINVLQLWESSLTLQRGEFLKVKGTIDTRLYFVESGCLRVFLMPEEEELTIRFAYQNNLFVALDSFISEAPSDLYIQAIKKTKLRVMSKSAFTRLLNSEADAAHWWRDILEVLVFQQFERETDLLISSPAERYRRVLARSPQLFQEVPHKYIASYLRMTPETLSRLKKS